MSNDYVSHIILLPQDADWTWYETLRPYLEAFRVTVTKSADDAGSFHGARHTITILQSPGAWPDGIIPFFRDRYPHAALDVINFTALTQLADLLNQRVAQGEDGRYAGGQALGPFGPAPTGASTYDSHIVLIPNGSDWSWYQATQRYVLNYRATVTQSADDAGSFHGRNHTVTAIVYPGAWGGHDIVAYFTTNYPNAKIDLVQAATTDELTKRLKARVVHDDRFGAHEPYADDLEIDGEDKFHLHWPLDAELVTWFGPPYRSFSRHFGASPWDYRPGFPAHEGLDFNAPTGKPVYACADGEVTELDNDPSHLNQQARFPYGFFVRIRHNFRGAIYETLYAHLSEVSVQLGQVVQTGQPIGKSGATGRASGPHLHLNLKAPGVQLAGYPAGITDPLPYLKWPDGWLLTPRDDLPHIYGVHDEYDGPEVARRAGSIMQQAGVRGYILWTEGIGANPNEPAGVDYRPRLTGDHVVMVRLNNGYGDEGTLPKPKFYEDFARRCANFVRNSSGPSIYIIGNEMNNPREWPQGKPIMPEDYARCFNLVYQRIKDVKPEAIVCPGAIDPYNAQLLFQQNSPYGDIRLYWQTMLDNIPVCDGLAVHAYTHGPDPRSVEDEQRVFGQHPLETVRYHFWVFEDVLNATPDRFRQLPVYLTETDHIFIDREDNLGWQDVNSGWIWTMYQQVNEWNQRGGQQIHAALVYRYPNLDEWRFVDKANVVQDFKQSLTLKLKPYQRRA
jgi:murein DD-endopeptidase MepM/ murein hydrolase activator NlpD